MAIIWKPLRDLQQSWEPMQEVESLQRQMNRLFEQLMPTSSSNGDVGISLMPSVEMEETSDAVHLKLEIPGIEAKDLDVQVTEDTVSVSGERKSETKTEEKGMVRSEFQYGKFERVIPLPTHIQTDQVQAKYDRGVLTLTLPKSDSEKRKIVKVDVN